MVFCRGSDVVMVDTKAVDLLRQTVDATLELQR